MKYKRELHDTLWLIALQGLNYVMPLLVWPYLMVVLGAEKFGYIGFATAVCQYLMIVVDFGFNFTATKEVALHKNDKEALTKIFWTTLYAKGFLLLICMILLLFLAFCVPAYMPYRWTLLILFGMVVANTFSFVWLFQGLGEIRQISIVNAIAKLLILPLTFVLVKSSQHYLLAAILLSVTYLLGMLFSVALVFIKEFGPSFFMKPVWGDVVGSLKSSFPIFLSGAAINVYVALLVVVLGYYTSPVEVGRYTAAEKLVRSFCYLFFVPMSQAFFPKIAALAQEQVSNVRSLLKWMYFVIGGLMVVLLGVLLFGGGLLGTLLGQDYMGLQGLFGIMSPIPLFVVLGGISGQLVLLAMGDENDKKHYRNVYLCASVMAICMMFLLVPQGKEIGAACCLCVTEGFVCVALCFYAYKLLRKEKAY